MNNPKKGYNPEGLTMFLHFWSCLTEDVVLGEEILRPFIGKHQTGDVHVDAISDLALKIDKHVNETPAIENVSYQEGKCDCKRCKYYEVEKERDSLVSYRGQLIRALDEDLEMADDDRLWRADKYEELARVERAIYDKELEMEGMKDGGYR